MLPGLAETESQPAGEVRLHLNVCAGCSRRLDQYRQMVTGLAELRDELVQPPDALLARILDQVPARSPLMIRMADDERIRRAALSVGGAVVGAAAVGIVWWRMARRRALETAGPVEASGSAA
jgi:hypothetical protein